MNLEPNSPVNLTLVGGTTLNGTLVRSSRWAHIIRTEDGTERAVLKGDVAA